MPQYQVINIQHDRELAGIDFYESPKRRCKYCTRWVFIDNYHYSKTNPSRVIAHDRPWKPNIGMPEPTDHAGHCPALWNRTEYSDEKYRKLRIKHGLDPELPEQKLANQIKNNEHIEIITPLDKFTIENLNEKMTIPEPAHPENHKINTLTGEEVMKDLVSENQASLLHKRINRRKQEIKELTDALHDLQVHTEIMTKSFNNFVYTIGMGLSRLGETANEVVMEEIGKTSQPHPYKPLKQGERLDDYVGSR